MRKPDYAFKTSTHTFFAVPREQGAAEVFVYQAEPGGALLHFSLAAQSIPASLLNEETERAAMAWVMARGGRELHLNRARRPITPAELDHPPTGAVKQLVSIAPSNAEIVGALGAEGLLAGVESSSDFPPAVRSLPRLGPDLHVNMKALAGLEPQLVLASLTVPGMERNITALEQLGIPYLVLAPRNLAEIRQEIERVGVALGLAEKATAVIDALDAKLEKLARPPGAAHRRPVRVYLEWWPKPMFSPSRECWSNELIALAGGVNVFGELEGQSREISTAELVEADPEVIFLSWCGVPLNKLNPERVLQREGLQEVSAVRKGRIYPIDEALLGRPGPRVVEGIGQMAELLARAGHQDGRTL